MQTIKLEYKMTLKTIDELSNLSFDDLTELAAKGDTVLIERVSSDIRHNLPVIHGGWALRYVGPTSEDSFGKLVLVPKSSWAQGIWNSGQIVFARSTGLTEVEAKAWFKADIRNKHDFLPLLNHVLHGGRQELLARYGHSDRNLLIRGYLDYRSDFTRSEYLEWSARTQIFEPKHPRRMLEFSHLLREVVSDRDIDVKPTIGGESMVETKARPWE